MQENPNSRWANRPSVASHTFCTSPGGPPAAATIVSPARACSCIRPMTWPWVSSAPVSGTMSREVGGDRRAVERGVRVQRRGPHRLPALHRRADLVLPLLRGGEPGGRDLVGERGEGALGVADDAGGAEALGVVAVDVDRRELHVRVLEQRLRRGREVGQPRADGEHEVGLADQVVVDRGALQTDPADLPPGPLLHRALAGHGLQHRDAGRAGEGLQLGGGVGVDDAATGDDDRLAARAASSRATACDLVGVGDRAGGSPSRARRRTRPGSRTRGDWTSWGSDSTTAPVSTGSVSTRIACGSAVSSCSGRLMRSKNREIGRNASFTVASASTGCCSCCSTGPCRRVA